MTTIVYDHKNKQIAVDGRTTRSDIVCSDNSEKFRFVDGQVWFFTGIAGDQQLLVDWFTAGKDKPALVPECEALVIIDGKVYSNMVAEHGVSCQHELKFDESIGSGSKFALAALDHGKSAKEAVEYAATRDIYSGGKITVFSVETGEVIDE